MPCYLELQRLQGRRKVGERGAGPRTAGGGGHIEAGEGRAGLHFELLLHF